jgi:uncharacterized protein (TIRG00374 family)
LPITAAIYAGNALAASVPLAGPQLGAAFAFRRFTRLGVDAAVVGWTLVVAGVISSTTAALLLAVGAVLTGNDVAAAAGAAGGMLAIGVLLVATLALRDPRARQRLRRPARWMLGHSRRVLGRPAQDPDALIAEVAGRLQSIQLAVRGWLMVLAAGLLNWLADGGVLALSVVAVGAPIPWRGLLFAYGVGAAAGSVGVSPGELGVVEAALAVTLMGAGVRHPLAAGAVLVYRFVSFWLVVTVGWLIYLAGFYVAPTEGSTLSCRLSELPYRGDDTGLARSYLHHKCTTSKGQQGSRRVTKGQVETTPEQAFLE